MVQEILSNKCIKVMHTTGIFNLRTRKTCNTNNKILKITNKVIILLITVGQMDSIKTIKVTMKNILIWTLNM